MKIQPKSKKAIPPPPAVADLISKLLGYSDERLAAFLKQIDAWKWPRSDLNAWIKVLNKFDDIMDAIIREYNVEKLQLLEFKDSTKELLSRILRFERLLLENSTNRKTFNSYDRLNSLLSASDLDVVILALNVLLRPSQQYSSQPAVSHALSISTARLQSLAKRWSNLRENGIGLVELASSKREDVEGVPAEAREASLTFYRTDTPTTVTEQKLEELPEGPPVTPRKSSAPAPAPAPASNSVQVRVDEQTILAQPVMSVLSDAIKTHSIPESESFELLCRIRAAACLSSGKKVDREKLLIIRLLAIAIYGHTHSESQATSALFLYEPDLVAHISELLQVDQDIPISVQTAAIAALDALARYKNKLQEVLTAVNAGVNHGVLLALVRNMVVEVINPESTLPQSFVEALLAFLTYLASHASGGNMVVSAGLIPLLIQIIESRNPKRLPVISKTMQLLDNVIYTFTNAFSLFTASRGIEILVERIEYEIDTDIKEFGTSYQPCALSGLGELPTQRTAVLKHILRSMHRMMQSSGTAEGLRGLIDTSLLKSIKKIVEYRGLFGPNIFPLAINVMSTFVHNEPTSLAIIQEAGLPNLFYRAIEMGIEPAIEVIQALPNAIGALCLNEAGQAQLTNRPSILPSIISLFTSDKHLKVLIDKENAVVIGSAVDELIRHHPSLKLPVFEALKSTLAHIEAMGAAYQAPSEIKQWYHIVAQPQEQVGDSDVLMQDLPPAEQGSTTAVASSTEQDEDEAQEKTHDNPIVNYIDVLGRFLEGFFQHPHHCKDFVLSTDGLQRIGRITALPCLPYDFANSVASDSMVQVLRTMTEVATNETLLHLTEIVRTSLDDSKFFWETVNEESRLLSFVELSESDEVISNQQFRSLVTLHIRITLLSDVFATAGQSQGRTAIGLLQTLLNSAPRQVLVDLGALHRASTWENITLHRGLNLKGIETTSTPSIPVDDDPGQNGIISSVVDGTYPPPVSANGVNPQAPTSAAGSSALPSRSESPREWNASALKHITQGLPNALAPFFQAMVKMFHARRNPDSVQKKQIMESSKIVAEIMIDHLSLQDFKDRGSLFNYYSAILELFVLLLIDERTATNTLHSVAIVAFYRANGLQRVFEICDTLVSTVDELSKVPEDTRSDVQKKDLLHAYGAVKFAMHLIHPIISSKPLFESGQTILITSRDKKYTDADFFEPHDFLVKVRLAALPVVRRLWDSDWIIQAPLGVSRYVVRCVLEIANGENEESKGEPNAGGLLPPVVPRPHTPTEAQIRMLTDMGFPRSAVERALARTHNDVNTATELLLSQPFPMAPDPPQPAAVVPEPPTETQDDDESMEAEEEAETTPEPTAQADDNTTPSSDAASSEGDTPTAAPTGKTAEQWRTELSEAREPLKMNISRQSLHLIDEHLSLLFDLHIAFTKPSGHQQQAIRNLVEDVNNFSPNAYDVREQPLANRCRLLALVLCETPSSLESETRNTLMDHLLALLLSTKDTEHPPKWLAAHLLVTEALFTLADEPRSISAPQEGESIAPEPIPVGPSRSEARSTVFEFCLKLLSNEDLPADELLSVLRLFVLLTRDREMATQFVEREGLTFLFKRLKKSSVTGGSSYIASILRHIVEDSPTIQVIMRQTIKRYFNQPRTRMVDLTTYVRNCSAIALRDVNTFIDVTNNLCHVENPFSSSPLIKLQINDSSEGESEKAIPGSEPEAAIDMQVDNPPAVTSSVPQKHVETAIHLLMSELMNIVKDTSDAPQQPCSPRDNVPREDAMGSENQSGPDSGDANITSPDSQDKNQYVSFVMQCLTELLFSYDACKVAFLSYSSKKRSQQLQPKEPTSKFRTTTLNFILSELITYGTINPASDSKHRSRGALCSWAMNVVGALCVDTSAAQDIKEVSSDLLLVRKFVLETISKALKEFSSSTAPIEARYGRLLALADLCHRLLIVRVNPSTRKQQQEDVPTHLAKIMLEKNYVATLTNALSEVDLNYPNVRNLVASILRPLEFLTKIAIKMSKASGKGKEEIRQDEVEPSTSDEDEVMDDGNVREETPDLYRNSALGMYGGEMDDRQYTDDEEMGDSEDEQDVEMEYGDETGSEDTSASESESEDEALLNEGTGNVGETWEEGDEDDDLVQNPNDEDEDEDDDDDDEPDQDVDGEVDPDVEDDEDDEDEDGGMMWEDVQQPEGLGMLLHNVDDEPGLGVPIQVNHEDDEPDLGSEEEFLMDQGHINPEGLIDFGHAVLSGGLFLQRRHRSNAEQHSLVRSRNAPSAPETITHPLLLDITTQNRSNIGPQSRAFRTVPRIVGGAPPDLAQAIDEMLQDGGLQAVHQIIHHEGGEMFHIQVPISTMLHPSRRFIGGSARPDRAPRTSTHRQGREFDPLLTLQRWAEEMKILHGDFVVERVSRLTNHLLIAMLPTALEVQKQAKVKAEAAEAKRKAEEAKKESEEAKKKEEQEAQQKEAGFLKKALEEAIQKTNEGNQMQEIQPPQDPIAAEPDTSSGNQSDAQPSSNTTDPETSDPAVPQATQGGSTEDSTMEEMAANEPDQDTEMADASGISSTPANVEPVSSSAETSEAAPGASSEPVERVTVMIHGSAVDITDTGIDPTFLEALPDDMREEVINQHVRDQQASRVERPPDSQISTEFLDALPPDIRAEIIQQEAMERARRRTEESNRGPPREAAEIDPASFIASLDPTLRQAVLMEQDETFLQTLPSHMIAEVGAYRDEVQARRAHARNPIRPIPTAIPQAKKYTPTHDAIMLLDRPGISVLVRLLFYPQVLKKTLLFRVLVNLCENLKSRTELFNLLLAILQDGTGDLMAVDKSFAQMSVRNRDSKPTTPKAAGKQKAIESALPWTLGNSQMETVPDLIAQRCLEALTYIVNANDASSIFFLTEHEVPIGLRRPVGKKGKGKEKHLPGPHYPLVLLLNLLDRQNLLRTPAILESVVGLLATVTRPLTSLKDQNKPADPLTMLPPASLSANASAIQSSTSQPNPELRQEPDPTTVTPETVLPTVATPIAGTSSTDQAIADKQDKKAVTTEEKSLLPHPPQVPHGALRLIVNILTTGECSSRTFQQSLALIQHLSFIPDARDVIALELKTKAQECGQVLYADLDELAIALQDNQSQTVTSSVAGKFSPASSMQAKLLRVLKTIDYMYTPKAPPTNPLAPATTSNEDVEKVQAIYESFRFTPLWRRLGDCLSSIGENSETEHIATVLLPLIEALMVVCKFVGSKGTISRLARAASISSPRSPTTPKESMEDLFITFTDAHRKLLNLMVRNNPSLMSGSFSLLVNNSRVLDFDNKRNYFNQQLHRQPHTRERHGTLQLNVRRARVFEDSFLYLQRKTGEQIKHGKLSVRFYDEEGVDAGGLTREWFQILARQMFNPDYALFQPCAADKLTYQPNKASWVNPEHLSFFKFVGRVIGKAIYDGRLLDAYFARSLYRQILCKPVDYRDVEWVDPEYYNSLCWILENDPTVLDLTFSVEGDEFGVNKIVALKEDGAQLQVTNENKREYVQLSAQYRLYSSIKEQIENLLKGFYEIIPKDLITIFNEQELELLISGTPDVDVDEWRAATEYNGYTGSDPNIVWWWRALKSFNREERAKVLSFATGTSRVPLNGFLDLQGVQGVQKFSIHRAYGEPDRLPQAHTCFNQIDLPPYTSYEMLRQQLLLAINEGGEGFAFS